jgi:ferredoxin/flavodoxin---NADP+ reductase
MKIAIVGAGPAGLYAADEISRACTTCVIDLFERLPAPFGLLRYGVAPDHLKMKSLEKVLNRVLERPNVRFLGNVEFGRDLTRLQLLQHYDGVIYATGAPHPRTLNIPGEYLAGCTHATHFVAWYNGQPDCSFDTTPLRAASVAVIGAGNVSLDVARMLAKPANSLLGTDAPAEVIETLDQHRIRDIHILCRRSPAHARFTSKELLELGDLPDVAVKVDVAELDLDCEGEVLLRSDSNAERNVAILREWAHQPPRVASRRIWFRFNATPVEVHGEEQVSALGYSVPRATVTRRIQVQAVFSSIGSAGVALPDVPFDPGSGMIPNVGGRVITSEGHSPREFVTGWAGRAARGVLGTNKSDAIDLAGEVLAAGIAGPGQARADLLEDLRARDVSVVTLDGWRNIAAAEQALGHRLGRARSKINTWAELLSASRPSSPAN